MWILTFVINLLEKETLVLPKREGQTNSWMGAGVAKCFTSKWFEKSDMNKEKIAYVCVCVCVCVCMLLPSFCDDVFTSASEIVHSTTVKCFYPRAEYICVLGGESSTLPATYVHTC